MKKFQINKLNTGTTLFEGKFESFSECLEQAIDEQIDLSGANLTRQNLSTTNLDNALLSGADLSFSNLNHANLSEGNFMNANFFGANMVAACMAESDYSKCNFLGCSFGANILVGSIFDHCMFSTLSAFQLPFSEAESMQSCYFYFEDELLFSNSKPPVVVLGLSSEPVIISESSIYLGHRDLTSELARRLTLKITDNHKASK